MMGAMSTGTPQGSPLQASRSAALKPALIFAAVLILLAALLATSGPAVTHADPSYDTEEARFLQLINDYRAQNGLGPLVADSRLDASADWFANDMANDNYFAYNHHDNEDPPRGPSERAAAFGFNAPVGENLAAGFTSADAVMEAWKNSPGHNANMLGNYVVIGIGRALNSSAYYGVYWVTDFSPYKLPPASTPVPTPAPTPTPTPLPTDTPEPTIPVTPAPSHAPSATNTPNTTPTTQPISSTPAWGDTNCDGSVDPVDSVRILRLDAGLATTTPAGCPILGDGVLSNGAPFIWGDIDCSGKADAIDSLLVLRYDAGYYVSLAAGCPDLGASL